MRRSGKATNSDGSSSVHASSRRLASQTMRHCRRCPALLDIASRTCHCRLVWAAPYGYQNLLQPILSRKFNSPVDAARVAVGTKADQTDSGMLGSRQ
jgi:hypothetical protein